MHSNAYFVFAVSWIVSSAFLYGYHISALNSAQDPISCRSRFGPSHPSLLRPCIAMSDNLFGLLTSSYTIGGFLGSLYASRLADTHGRRKALLVGTLLIGLGSLTMALANLFVILLLGRTIVGLGCGINTVLVPIYLSEISPVSIRGAVGVMNQLAIVFGIFVSQLVSLPFAQAWRWRWIFVFSSLLAALQLLSAPFMVESPKWAMEIEARRSTKKPTDDDDDEEEAERATETVSQQESDSDPERQTLLNPDEGDGPNSTRAQNSSARDHISMVQLFREWKTDPALATGLKLVLITQLAQQFSGINAVLYYSTSIMKSVLPTQAIYISLFISAINLMMTFPPLILVDKLGRKSLLLISSSSMAITSLVLGTSINIGIAQLSSIAIVLFVASFSIGLGPVPFVILSEVVPLHAVSAAGSLGLAVNWASNFIVGLVFLPLRNSLASQDGDGDGNVFYIFTGLSCLATFMIFHVYNHC